MQVALVIPVSEPRKTSPKPPAEPKIPAFVRRRTGAPVVFLAERYGVVAGNSDRGDRSDFKRFRLWLADARRRVRKARAEEKRQEQPQRVTAWRADPVGMVIKKNRQPIRLIWKQ